MVRRFHGFYIGWVIAITYAGVYDQKFHISIRHSIDVNKSIVVIEYPFSPHVRVRDCNQLTFIETMTVSFVKELLGRLASDRTL